MEWMQHVIHQTLTSWKDEDCIPVTLTELVRVTVLHGLKCSFSLKGSAPLPFSWIQYVFKYIHMLYVHE